MLLRVASRLHNGDEVQVKETGEHVKVQSVYRLNDRVIAIEAMTQDGYRTLTHKEIK